MFVVTVRTGERRFRVIGRFATYREARRACRRALFKWWGGMWSMAVTGAPEVTRIEGGVYALLAQPTMCNLGRIECDADGYQTSFAPCGFIPGERRPHRATGKLEDCCEP